MKVTLNWLKQYVEFDWSPDALAERLILPGVKIEDEPKGEGGLLAQAKDRSLLA